MRRHCGHLVTLGSDSAAAGGLGTPGFPGWWAIAFPIIKTPPSPRQQLDKLSAWDVYIARQLYRTLTTAMTRQLDD